MFQCTSSANQTQCIHCVFTVQIQIRCIQYKYGIYSLFSANTVYIQCKYSVYWLECPSLQIQWVAHSHDVEWRQQGRSRWQIHLQNEFLQNYNSSLVGKIQNISWLGIDSLTYSMGGDEFSTQRWGRSERWPGRESATALFMQIPIWRTDSQTERNTLRPFTEAEFPSFGSQTAHCWTAARALQTNSAAAAAVHLDCNFIS